MIRSSKYRRSNSKIGARPNVVLCVRLSVVMLGMTGGVSLQLRRGGRAGRGGVEPRPARRHPVKVRMGENVIASVGGNTVGGVMFGAAIGVGIGLAITVGAVRTQLGGRPGGGTGFGPGT